MPKPGLAGDIIIGALNFKLATTKQLEAMGAARAWQIDWLEDSTRRKTGVDRNTSQTKDTVEFAYRWEMADYGYGDSEDIRDRRYDWGYCQAEAPLRIVCPHKRHTITLTGATADVTAILEATDNGAARIYASGGRYIFIIDPSDDSSTTIDCGVGLIAQDMAIFEDYIYITFTAANIKRFGPLSTGGSLSAAHASLNFRWLLAANESLYGWQPLSGATAGLLRKCAASASGSAWTAGNWSAGENVGFGQTNGNKPMVLGGYIFQGKPEGLFTFDLAGEVKSVMPDMVGYLDQRNNHHGTAFRGRLYLPHETGLYAYSPSTNRVVPVGPEMHEFNTSAIKGYVREAAGVGRFIYIAIEDNSANNYILKGYPAPISDKESFAWHPQSLIPSQYLCQAMYFSSLSEPRLWFGHGSLIGYYRLGSTLTYENGQITFPPYDDGYPFDDKILEKGAVEGATPTGTSMGLYYTLDGGTERTVAASMTVGTETAISANNVGKRVSPRVALNAKSDNTATPTLRSITLTGLRRPSTRAIITANIVASDNQYMRNNQLNKLTAAEIAAQLRTWATNTSSVTVVDPNGTSRTMMVLPGVKEQEIGILDDRQPETVITVMLRA